MFLRKHPFIYLFIELLIAELEEGSSFSIGIDASNTGNIKMFPLVCRYFLKGAGGI
jgi:hypothetical protein